MPDPASAPVLGFDGLTMEFPGVRALDAVSFGVRAGSGAAPHVV